MKPSAIPPEISPADAEVLDAILGPIKRMRSASKTPLIALEVGSWVGNGSTSVIAKNVSDVSGSSSSTLFCVDTWEGSPNVVHHQAYKAKHDLFAIFQQNVLHYQNRGLLKPVIKASVEAAKLFPDNLFDFVFLDGNHGYSYIKQDIEVWLPKVTRGGVLCGHDCEARYDYLPRGLQAEIIKRGEEDYIENHIYAGPQSLHPGVVRAVHEAFDGRAVLWIESRFVSTIWSYKNDKPRQNGHAGALL